VPVALNIRKSLLQFIFSGAYMKRWNDRLRPAELIEIDKQAHKMIIAWLLCRLSGTGRTSAERIALEEKVVEGGIFDYIFRLAITDIKPPVLDRIRANPEDYRQLAAWAAGEVESRIRPLDDAFFVRFLEHIRNPEAEGETADILRAAHTLASVWELRLLLTVNDSFDEEIKDIDEHFRRRTDAYAHVPGVTGMADVFNGNAGSVNTSPSPQHVAAAQFAALCGRLRFQKRWSLVPRIPETSVMGHMFVTKSYGKAYGFSRWMKVAPPPPSGGAAFSSLPNIKICAIIPVWSINDGHMMDIFQYCCF
jgi:putative hydrolase of HD superfamily